MIHPSLRFTDHRPWPLPQSPWTMAQTWSNLLFAHWRVPVSALRPWIPQPLEVDTFDGEAWIGVVPFELTIRPRLLPVVPKIAAFPEINVRTYVTLDNKPGVWFFSLDATSPIAVRAARWGFSLPYFDAQISCQRTGEQIQYISRRSKVNHQIHFVASYQPTGDPWVANPDSLESWLTERYCLYAANHRGKISRTEVHHARWSLQNATCQIEENTMTSPIDLRLEAEPLCHFANWIDVVNWLPQRTG